MSNIAAFDASEVLRRLLTAWYRSGHPWKTQPTLADFRRQGKLDVRTGALLDKLIARYDSGMEVQNLRLHHLIDLQ